MSDAKIVRRTLTAYPDCSNRLSGSARLLFDQSDLTGDPSMHLTPSQLLTNKPPARYQDKGDQEVLRNREKHEAGEAHENDDETQG